MNDKIVTTVVENKYKSNVQQKHMHSYIYFKNLYPGKCNILSMVQCMHACMPDVCMPEKVVSGIQICKQVLIFHDR